MKKCFLILACVGLLAACGRRTDVATPPTTSNFVEVDSAPVTVSDQTSGSFRVDSRSPNGVQFQNTSSQEAAFELSASGQWSFAPEAGMLGPTGVSSPASRDFLLPGARSFALIARQEDGAFVYIGDKAQMNLKPGASLFFIMNDLLNGFGDNRGSLTVSWLKKP
jgi:hypothetical protein